VEVRLSLFGEPAWLHIHAIFSAAPGEDSGEDSEDEGERPAEEEEEEAYGSSTESPVSSIARVCVVLR